LGCADSDTTGIQRGVRAAVDNEPAVRCRRDPVAVMPHAWKALEVGGPILRAIGIVPESDRHRGKRVRADELARRMFKLPSRWIERAHIHAQPRGLNLA